MNATTLVSVYFYKRIESFRFSPLEFVPKEYKACLFTGYRSDEYATSRLNVCLFVRTGFDGLKITKRKVKKVVYTHLRYSCVWFVKTEILYLELANRSLRVVNTWILIGTVN